MEIKSFHERAVSDSNALSSPPMNTVSSHKPSHLQIKELVISASEVLNSFGSILNFLQNTQKSNIKKVTDSLKNPPQTQKRKKDDRSVYDR